MAYTRFKPLTSAFTFGARLNINEDITDDVTKLFSNDEKALVGVKNGVDLAIFTNRRILLVKKVNISLGVEKFSIPYTSISTFSFIAHKSSSSLKLTLNNAYPIKLRFKKDYDNITITEIYGVMSNFMLNRRSD
jgi:hypothetical protein